MGTHKKDLYDAIEAVLKANKKRTYTAVQLFELAEIKKHAQSANRVSDYAGNLWRKGVLLRLPAPRIKGEASLWMYQWKGLGAPRVPTAEDAVEYRPKKVLLALRDIEVSHAGEVVTIECGELSIVIRPKQPSR